MSDMTDIEKLKEHVDWYEDRVKTSENLAILIAFATLERLDVIAKAMVELDTVTGELSHEMKYHTKDGN